MDKFEFDRLVSYLIEHKDERKVLQTIRDSSSYPWGDDEGVCDWDELWEEDEIKHFSNRRRQHTLKALIKRGLIEAHDYENEKNLSDEAYFIITEVGRAAIDEISNILLRKRTEAAMQKIKRGIPLTQFERLVDWEELARKFGIFGG